jgi:hypothetical protein
VAFFPAYPALIRLFSSLPWVEPRGAAFMVTALAGLAAAAGIFLIARDLIGARAALVVLALWACWPHGVVLSMAYSEALFTAFAAWSLFALMRRRWLAAAGLCLLAGLTRPTALAVAAAIAVSGLVALLRRQDGWRPLVAILVSPLSALAFLAYVGWLLGRWDGWFWMQRLGWYSHFDFGRYELAAVRDSFSMPTRGVFVECSVVLIVAALLLLLLIFPGRAPLPLIVYSATVFALAVGTAGYHWSKPRFLLPAFPLLLVPSSWLARLPSSILVPLFVVVASISAWYGSYILLEWPASP